MSPSLLVRLGLRRPGPWEPPSVLDRLLDSPFKAIAFFLWRASNALRLFFSSSLNSSSKDKKAIRVVCISDTHDLLVQHVPAGDLLIHAGDLTNAGTPTDLQIQLDWLAAQPHRHKIVVAGNHDTWLDPAARAAAHMTSLDEYGAPVFPRGVHYLEHDSVVLDFDEGRKLTVYGAPDIPQCGPPSFAFQYDPSFHPWKDSIPSAIDILVTHPPPHHHCDLDLGCPGLLREIWRVRPPLHVFGHVHWGAGREVLHWDASQKAYETLLDDDGDDSWVNRARQLLSRLYLLGVLLFGGILSAVTPRQETRTTVLINAAQMYGNTGRLGHNVQVIDL